MNTPSCAPAMSSAPTLAFDTLLQHSGMLYFCHASNSRRYIKPLDLARSISLYSALALTTPLQDWPPPSPLLLEVACPVDCCPGVTCSCPISGPLTCTLKSPQVLDVLSERHLSLSLTLASAIILKYFH